VLRAEGDAAQSATSPTARMQRSLALPLPTTGTFYIGAYGLARTLIPAAYLLHRACLTACFFIHLPFNRLSWHNRLRLAFYAALAPEGGDGPSAWISLFHCRAHKRLLLDAARHLCREARGGACHCGGRRTPALHVGGRRCRASWEAGLAQGDSLMNGRADWRNLTERGDDASASQMTLPAPCDGLALPQATSAHAGTCRRALYCHRQHLPPLLV